MRARWRAWLESTYATPEALAAAWGRSSSEVVAFDAIEPPESEDAPGSRPLLDYQRFREDVADAWTRRQVAAIKAADPDALTTVGLIQWSVPVNLPAPRVYSAFRPARQAPLVDFLEIHFYPFADGAYAYQGEHAETRNLAYLDAVVQEVARPGKAVVLAEFGWYGGITPRFDPKLPAASEADQERWCRRVVETTRGAVVGWLNWGMYDHPEAGDCTEGTGLLAADGREKAWGRTFARLAAEQDGRMIEPRPTHRPPLDWDACLTSPAAARAALDRAAAARP